MFNNNPSQHNQQRLNERLKVATSQMREQIAQIRMQMHTTRSELQNRIEGAKSQIIELTQKIETDIQTIEQQAEVIEKEALDVQDKTADHNISFVQEILRKSIHLASLCVPICYIFFRREHILMVLVPLMILIIAADIATKLNPLLRTVYLKVFGFMLRKHEIKKGIMTLNGASWVMISVVLTIFIFPKIVAIVAMSILFTADMVAAIIGRRYGKKRIFNLQHKSIIGTTAFFVTATLVVCIYGLVFAVPLPYYIIGTIAAAAAAVAEALSGEVLNVDDNLAIPLSFGIIMCVGNYFTIYFCGINCLL
jgi:dolichol kinase